MGLTWAWPFPAVVLASTMRNILWPL